MKIGDLGVSESPGWVGKTPVKPLTGKASQAQVVFGVFRGGMNEFCPFQLQERRLNVHTGPGARCVCVSGFAVGLWGKGADLTPPGLVVT